MMYIYNVQKWNFHPAPHSHIIISSCRWWRTTIQNVSTKYHHATKPKHTHTHHIHIYTWRCPRPAVSHPLEPHVIVRKDSCENGNWKDQIIHLVPQRRSTARSISMSPQSQSCFIHSAWLLTQIDKTTAIELEYKHCTWNWHQNRQMSHSFATHNDIGSLTKCVLFALEYASICQSFVFISFFSSPFFAAVCFFFFSYSFCGFVYGCFFQFIITFFANIFPSCSLFFDISWALFWIPHGRNAKNAYEIII